MPYIESICRDRFAMLISRELEQFGIRELTEDDMPKSKRVGHAFACADLQLPCARSRLSTPMPKFELWM